MHAWLGWRDWQCCPAWPACLPDDSCKCSHLHGSAYALTCLFGSHDPATFPPPNQHSAVTIRHGSPDLGMQHAPEMAALTRLYTSPHLSTAWMVESCECQTWLSWPGNMFHHTLAPKGGILSNARFGSHDQATCLSTLWRQRVGYWAMPDLAVMTRQHVSPHSGAKGWKTEQCQIWQSWSGNMSLHPQRCMEVGRLCMPALSILMQCFERCYVTLSQKRVLAQKCDLVHQTVVYWARPTRQLKGWDLGTGFAWALTYYFLSTASCILFGAHHSTSLKAWHAFRDCAAQSIKVT